MANSIRNYGTVSGYFEIDVDFFNKYVISQLRTPKTFEEFKTEKNNELVNSLEPLKTSRKKRREEEFSTIENLIEKNNQSENCYMKYGSFQIIGHSYTPSRHKFFGTLRQAFCYGSVIWW